MAVEESERNVQAMLARILQRLDDQVVLGDKRYEEQTSFNAKVSQELLGIRKQMEVTAAEVDEVRRGGSTSHSTGPTQVDTTRPLPGPTASRPGSGNTTPRLANDGPPLISEVPRPQHVRPNADPEIHREREQDGGYVKPPKHDFPRFDGSLPTLWLDRCLAYFDMYNVRPENWVTTASLYVDGHAALWLQAYRQLNVQVPWHRFCQAVIEEFGPDEFEDQMHKLLQLRQSGTVTEYRLQFEVYMYQLLALDPSLSTKFFVTQFVLGLKDELRAAVRIQAPTSITRATVFARIQEEELEATRPRHRPIPAGRPPPAMAQAAARPEQLQMILQGSASLRNSGEPIICVLNVATATREIISVSGKVLSY